MQGYFLSFFLLPCFLQVWFVSFETIWVFLCVKISVAKPWEIEHQDVFLMTFVVILCFNILSLSFPVFFIANLFMLIYFKLFIVFSCPKVSSFYCFHPCSPPLSPTTPGCVLTCVSWLLVGSLTNRSPAAYSSCRDQYPVWTSTKELFPPCYTSLPSYILAQLYMFYFFFAPYVYLLLLLSFFYTYEYELQNECAIFIHKF